MLKLLVLFLVLPQMLMPSGMCICQCLSLAKSGPESHGDRTLTTSIGNNHRPECTCESCRLLVSAIDSTDIDTHDATSTDDPCHSKPDMHCPGCPATVGVLPVNATVPNVLVQTDLVDSENIVRFTLLAIVLPVHAVAPLDNPAILPPFFISQCSLLI